ncbi:MAG TPA: MarR family transcriptional regulator [Trebonia sp.]|nr:MarR family transcriptional regulator [Trebonia sp.]
MSERSGYELPLLLLGAFRSIIDDLHAELARCGHEQARPIHGFALQAIGRDGITIGELGRRLGVTKQAAAKTARSLEQAGYVERSPHAADGRSWVLARTRRGLELLELSAQIFDRLRHRWADQLGQDRIRDLEQDLAALTSRTPAASAGNFPGWLQ